MNRGVRVGLAVIFIVGAGYLFLHHRAVTSGPIVARPALTATPPSIPSAPFPVNVKPASPGALAASNAAVIAPAATVKNPIQPEVVAAPVTPDATAAQIPPAAVLQNIHRAVHQYGDMFGGNPVGTNPEITSQLSGNNPKHINFVSSQAGMTINGDGAMVDEWGTPYFFHQISGTEMEIHSAGPDKIMWTPDDLVAK